jgi:hypothetical protein
MTVMLSRKGMNRATAHLERRSSRMTDAAISKKYFLMPLLDMGESFTVRSNTFNFRSALMQLLDAARRPQESAALG